MTLYLLAWTWSGVFWTLLSIVLFFVSLLLIVVVLVQDSKDSGLGSAFGGGGGGNALLGARMQKDLAKATSLFGIIVAICVIILGLLDNFSGRQSVADSGDPAAATAPADGSLEPTADGNADEESAPGEPAAPDDSAGAGGNATTGTPPDGAAPSAE